MDELGADLILLSALGETLHDSEKLGFGLSGAELVRLVAARRVGIDKGRIAVLDPTPTTDPLLDEALASMAGGRRGPTAKAWVARRRKDHVQRYHERLAASGIILSDPYKVLGFIPAVRWKIADTARAAQARARLEAVAASTGPVQPAQAALAGLATAIGAAHLVFPGWAGRAARKRLKEAARGDLAAASASRAAGAARSAEEAQRDALNDSLASAIDSAVQAAVHAATDAAHHAAHNSGHTGHVGHSDGAVGHF